MSLINGKKAKNTCIKRGITLKIEFYNCTHVHMRPAYKPPPSRTEAYASLIVIAVM